MAKLRIYEVAKEFGTDSATVISILRRMGEFVRSASSTRKVPIAQRLSAELEALGAQHERPASRPAATSASPEMAQRHPPPASSFTVAGRSGMAVATDRTDHKGVAAGATSPAPHRGPRGHATVPTNHHDIAFCCCGQSARGCCGQSARARSRFGKPLHTTPRR